MPEDDLAALVHAEHVALLGVRARPLFQAVTRWPRAIPQYTLGHLERIARVQAAAQRLPGLRLCANWIGGVAVGDCVRNGHLEAEALVAALRERA
jgi:oxygen-dependent protoporphyrinogen oxidase